MKRLRTWLLTLTACLATSIGLVLATSTPAYAGPLTTFIFGSSHPYYTLGEGYFEPAYFAHDGSITVKDTFCDGDNGIIAAVYYQNYNEWKRTDLVSVRGCGWENTNPTENLPYGATVRFRTCKLLPDGTWKDCIDKYTTNDEE
jgi:hypothetical protein